MKNTLKSKISQNGERSESQALRRFKNGIEEEKTYLDYKKNLDKFCEHISMNYDQIVKLEIDTLQNHLEDWVMSLSERGLEGVTTKKMLAGVMKFLDMNRRLYHKKALIGLVRENRNKSDDISGNVPYTGADIKRMLEGTKKLRTKAIIHFFNSTGARPQSFTDPVLRMKHLFIQYDENGKDTGCYAVRIYDNSPEGFSENSKHGYWAFLTPEARNALDAYFKSRKLNGEVSDPESPLLATYTEPGKGLVKNRHMEVPGIYDALELAIKSAGVERKKIDERFDKAIVYGFRKRFNTILKLGDSINPNIAEKLIHHKKGLDGRYLTPTREECFAEFRKAIPLLTISDSERVRAENEMLKKENSEKAASLAKISSLEQGMSSLKDQFEQMTNLSTGYAALNKYLTQNDKDAGRLATQILLDTFKTPKDKQDFIIQLKNALKTMVDETERDKK